jgi:matrixin
MTRASLLLLPLALGIGFTGATHRSFFGSRPHLARHSADASGSLGHEIESAFDRVPGPEDARVAARRKIEESESTTYIAEILAEHDSSVARWPDRRTQPLTVWVQPASGIADFNKIYVEQVRQAFEEWDRLQLPVHFTFVNDSADADVHVNWVDRFSEPISGRTRWTRDDDWLITDANILLALHHIGGERLDYDAMHAIALHEIGHLLGLDHTQDTLSIMAPRVRVRELSNVDTATVRLIYALPAGPLR